LGVGSLILILHTDFYIIFLAFLGGVGLAVTVCLLAQVYKVLALALVDGSLIDSSSGDRAEIEMVKIRISPSNLGTGEMKLSNACI
jgi:hypothetical protein